ncbi:MAG: sigma-70 family RNA polymerase sigma factor [Nibricoccus sp.]
MKAMLDDAVCLKKYAETRDQAAFSDFVHRNLRLVYSAAFRQTGGDAHLAQDITQVVFTTAAQHAKALAGHPLIPAWLHQTTRNSAIDAIRSRERQKAREEAVGEMNDSSTASDDHLDWDKLSPDLDKIVASLKADDRDAIILRFFGEKSFAEIGQQLSVSENAARMRVERALEKLRTLLSRKGIVSSATALSVILAEKAAIAAPTGLGTATVTAALSAPSAAGLASIFGIIKIMSTAKIIAGITTTIAVVSLATAFHEYRAARTAEAALSASKDVLPAKAPLPEPTTDEAKTSVPAKAPTQQANAGPNTQSSNPFSPVIALLNNPAIQAQANIQTKIRLDGQYAPLFKQLELRPEQLEHFKNLIVEKQMVAFDSITAANDQGLNPFADPQGFMQLVTTAEKAVDNQIAAELGENGFKQFLAFQLTVPARNTVSYLQQALSFTATPLTEQQSEKVIEILTRSGVPAIPPNSPLAVLNADLGVVKLNENARPELQGVLSEPQQRVLDQKIQQQLQLLEARSRMSHPGK